MKKIIAALLCIFSIVICSWLIINQLKFLDIPSNKNETSAIWEIHKIMQQTNINECDKKILINKIEMKRNYQKRISGVAFQTQIICFVIIIIQLVLFVFILLMPNKSRQNGK